MLCKVKYVEQIKKTLTQPRSTRSWKRSFCSEKLPSPCIKNTMVSVCVFMDYMDYNGLCVCGQSSVSRVCIRVILFDV